MKRKNRHLGRSLQEVIAEHRARDPEFSAVFDRLRLARKLRELREARHLTQTELAERVGTKQSVIARMESSRVIPRLDLLQRVAFALGLALKVDFLRPQRGAAGPG